MRTSWTRIPSVPWSAFTPPSTSITSRADLRQRHPTRHDFARRGHDLLDEHATHFDEVTWTSEPRGGDSAAHQGANGLKEIGSASK